VIIGVTGGIAAYKATGVIRGFTAAGHSVKVVPTQNALRFIGSATLEALSHNSVDPELFTDIDSVKHIALAQEADVIVVAPATAAFLARYASGIADDLLLNVLLATKATVFVAPAMHTEMWLHPATISNVATLRSRGVHILEPAMGQLTGSDVGAGRLPEPAEIVNWVLRGVDEIQASESSSEPSSLADKHIVITAGGTREPIDAVRFIGNYSSGKQGYAFARQAVARGARVTLIGANLVDPQIFGCEFIAVATGLELSVALSVAATSASAVIMAAAVADFKLDRAGRAKIKKSTTGDALDLHLVATADIIAELAHSKITPHGCLLMAFAAETLSGNELIAEARRKLIAKSVDYVIANDVSEGKIFGSDETDVLLINDETVLHFAGGKDTVAGHILDLISSEI
jgi:phosphopantothenoylcysteine decarboxylase/phosphopantothenate--cysteine ligase